MALFDVSPKSTPLFSFYSIIDEDISLIRMVMDRYYDKNVFDFSEIQTWSVNEIISFIYYRPFFNPLSAFIIDDSKEDFVNECYFEFIDTKEDEILEYGMLTEIANLIALYDEAPEVSPSILYYNDLQKQTLQQMEQLQNVPLIHISQVKFNNHTQFFFKRCEEAIQFKKAISKTFYFASTTFNEYKLLHMEDEAEYKYLKDISVNNLLSLFDMYRTDLVRKDLFYNDK